MLHWNEGSYPVNEVQPVTVNGTTPERPPRRKRAKLNSVAPSVNSNNKQGICNNSIVCEIDSDEMEEKISNGLRSNDNALHI